MNLPLSQKALALLNDAKASEQLCAEKYHKAANNANCPELSQLFSNLAQQEENHLNLITQMTQGQIPQYTPYVSASAGIAHQNQPQSPYTMMPNVMNNAASPAQGGYNQADKALLDDLLKDEKYMSNLYDTAIFEQTDGHARQLLNTIQQQEQEHGKMLYDYMNAHGMYGVN